MLLDLNAKYDTIIVLDIPDTLVSESLKNLLTGEERYKDAEENEHMYNATHILEGETITREEIVAELTRINELCHNYKATYFRITFY